MQHKFKKLFYTQTPVLNAGFKISDVHIQIRLRFGIVNLINTHLKLNFNPKEVYIELNKPNPSLKNIIRDSANFPATSYLRDLILNYLFSGFLEPRNFFP